MTSNGWLFEQVVIRMGGPNAVLSMLPNQDAIQEIANGTTINDLPLALLAKVLSHVERRSIFAMMQVCKVWLKAIHEQHHFWKRHIENALEYVISVNKVTYKQHQAAIRMFNTFYSPVPETLRQQVEWVFKVHLVAQKWINLHEQICFNDSNMNEFFVIERTTWNNQNLANWIALHALQCTRVTSYVGKNFDDREGRYVNQVLVCMTLNSSYCEFLDVPKYREVGSGTFISKKSNATFVGCVSHFPNSGGYQAHGDGKWTFDDGTVLEGKGVAHNGEPRFIMEAEDVREWKRRRVVVPGPFGAGDERIIK